MLFTKSLALAVMATIAGANANALPPARPVAPGRPGSPQFNVQTINCGAGASPFCCSPSTANANSGGLMTDGDQDGGSTCSKMSGSVQCNAIVICCNNNGKNAAQSCSGSISQLKQPVVIV